MYDEPPKKKLLASFNDRFGYILTQIFRFVWIILKFIIKAGLIFIVAYPFIFIGMSLINPVAAVASAEAIIGFIKHVIDIISGQTN